MTTDKELHINYLFNAAPAVVFEAWTRPEHLAKWYAPEGCSIEFRAIDVREGGTFHSCIHDPVHGDCWIIGRYDQVVVPELLVFSMVLSNAQGDAVTAQTAGKSDDWPEALITTVTFTPVGNQTQLTLHQTVDESEARKTGAYQSWFSMFGKLEEWLG